MLTWGLLCLLMSNYRTQLGASLLVPDYFLPAGLAGCTGALGAGFDAGCTGAFGATFLSAICVHLPFGINFTFIQMVFQATGDRHKRVVSVHHKSYVQHHSMLLVEEVPDLTFIIRLSLLKINDFDNDCRHKMKRKTTYKFGHHSFFIWFQTNGLQHHPILAQYRHDH